MPRDLQHFIISGLGQTETFKAKGGGSTKRPSDVPNRAQHAQALLQALDALPNIAVDALPGVYLEVLGRPGEVMITNGLNASDLTLLAAEPGHPQDNQPPKATVFASAQRTWTNFATRSKISRKKIARRRMALRAALTTQTSYRALVLSLKPDFVPYGEARTQSFPMVMVQRHGRFGLISRKPKHSSLMQPNLA